MSVNQILFNITCVFPGKNILQVWNNVRVNKYSSQVILGEHFDLGRTLGSFFFICDNKCTLEYPSMRTLLRS